MILQSISDPIKAHNMGKFMAEIMDKAFGENRCTIILSDDQSFHVTRLIGTSSSNNAGTGDEWLYYGSVTVETESGAVYIIDASTIEQVL